MLAAAQAVRTAVVAKYAPTEPQKAQLLWPGHPAVTLNQALAGIALAAARGEAPPPQLVERGIAVSRKAPLESGPFLLRGAQAQEGGDAAAAERAFLEARRRNPRDWAARYFLAERYLTDGRTAAGLSELTILARMAPGGDVSPFLASFARTPGALPHLKRLFAEQPQFEPLVLLRLSTDIANTDLVEALASPNAYQDEDNRHWLTNLLALLVQNGEYDRAFQLWQRASGASGRFLIFDPEFSGDRSPPPFNWSFYSGSAGFAEPRGGGSLRITYYGRESAVFASQVLLLEPGSYTLSNRVSGSRDMPRLLAWRLTCLPGEQRVVELPLQARPDGPLAVNFRIGAEGCEAQRLELAGTAPEFPQQVDLVISDLRLSRAGQ